MENNNPEGWEKVSQAVRSGAQHMKAMADQTARAARESKFWRENGKAVKTTLSEIAGPLAVAYLAAFKFLGGLIAVVKASELIKRGLDTWTRVQYYTPSFARLLGGLGAAKARLRELAGMSARGPFQFDDLVAANRSLEIFTRGALSGRKGMEMVQDAAAAAGTSTAVAGDAIGRAYDAIERRTGVDGAIQRLREMGIISTVTADEMRVLAERGGSVEQMQAALQGALSRNNGAAAALSGTLAGMAQQMENVKEQNLSQIGELFEEGKMAGMRAGLVLLREYGPVVVDLLRPVAALSAMWGRLMEVLANVAAASGVKEALSGILKVLTAMALVFAGRAIASGVAGLVALIGMLLKIPAAGAVATRGLGVMLPVLRALGLGLMRLLGPVGLLSAGLVMLADAMGLFKGDSLFGGSVAKSAEELRSLNDDVQKQVAAAGGGGSLAAKAEAMASANEAAREAQKARRAAEQKGFGWGNVALGAASGAQIGAMVGGLPGAAVGAGVGALGGAGLSFWQQGKDREAAQMAREQEARALRQQQDARAASVVTPAQYLNDPDFAAAKAAGEQRLAQLQEEADLVAKMRSAAVAGGGTEDTPMVRELDARAASLDQKMKDVAAGVTPEALEQAMNKRLAGVSSQAAMLRSIGSATGDRAKTMEADRLDAQVTEERRRKELLGMGIGPEQAGMMARAEGLAGLAEQLAQRGQVIASGRAGVGGAAGEAAGGIPREFQAVIEEIKAIQQKLSEQMGGAEQERVARKLAE